MYCCRHRSSLSSFRHNRESLPCPCRFFPLEIEALWSRTHDIEVLHCSAARRVENAVAYHRTGLWMRQARHTTVITAIQMRWQERKNERDEETKSFEKKRGQKEVSTQHKRPKHIQRLGSQNIASAGGRRLKFVGWSWILCFFFYFQWNCFKHAGSCKFDREWLTLSFGSCLIHRARIFYTWYIIYPILHPWILSPEYFINEV